jgi:hypothetical protein
VESREVALVFIPTKNQLADILTTTLYGSKFESHRKVIGVCDMSLACPSFMLKSDSYVSLVFSVGCMIFFNNKKWGGGDLMQGFF